MQSNIFHFQNETTYMCILHVQCKSMLYFCLVPMNPYKSLPRTLLRIRVNINFSNSTEEKLIYFLFSMPSNQLDLGVLSLFYFCIEKKNFCYRKNIYKYITLSTPIRTSLTHSSEPPHSPGQEILIQLVMDSS